MIFKTLERNSSIQKKQILTNMINVHIVIKTKILILINLQKTDNVFTHFFHFHFHSKRNFQGNRFT